MSLREAADLIPSYPATPEIRVGCPDHRKFEVVKALVNSFKQEGYEVIDIDGARIQFPDGFALVRASNTQPVLVLRVEARTPERLEELKTFLYDRLKAFPEIDFSEGGH